MTTRLQVTSGSPYEASFGFARAVREGNRIIVAGTGPVEPDGSTTPGGAAEQAARCCTIILAAIEALGGSAADVVRTRMLLTDPADQDAVGAAKPAATMAGVAWLCRPEWRIEIEAEAVVPG
ncbi:RidA family protein [Porphyrobacter sp. AAP82]|uniref:RidA family protein n=1 Tax=Porphyrobacter sp. AAP82 TaxID=1248917 RepID=UPI00037FF7E5|nr:RidA family protein [Porphyrobacter sp. AAP82]